MKLELNPKLKVKKLYIEKHNFYVYIIDDVITNPEAVVEFATKHAYFQSPGKDGTLYPGVRELMPKPYERLLNKAIESSGLANTVEIYRCLLSLITLKENEINYLQTVPHVDSIDSSDFACVHFFCDDSFGGTSLYEYKDNGLATVTADNLHKMQEMVDRAHNQNKHACYLSDDNQEFETLCSIPAKFNRLVLYPSNQLHCANINGKSIDRNPETGRLTIASFFRILS
ncbi:DUF6445 family protein [Pseudoalteromonas piscicida]|uniref:Uncharacterized protein n=1 Tax=Pseudoalteromonas piscicida TaxID=43662 RepID=A0A2A5JPD5_PSEO7|nr:DUF6445 family protein [Pseudoalteromonas piscicida]PCK31260.1 hypothetical protein CEX98_13235 [Pseudoalteromonas piscicida]